MVQYCFGADVGGTTVKLGLFNEAGIVIDKWEIPTRSKENKILEDYKRTSIRNWAWCTRTGRS